MKEKPVSEAADRVLFWLKTKGSQTAQQISKRLQVTPMAVRQHLYVLEEQGLVTHYDEARKVGRPARIWQLTADAEERFPDSHAELAVGILQAVEKAFGSEGMQRLVEARTKRQIRLYQEALPVNASLEKKVAALTAFRQQEGYMAEWAKKKRRQFHLD